MANPLAVGTGTGVSSGLVQQPDIEWTIEDKIRCAVTLTGPYSAGVAATLGSNPTYYRGQRATLDGITNMTVEKINLKRKAGGRGIVILTYSKPLPEDPDNYSEEAAKPECEWVELSRPIESHPRYTLNQNLDGTAAGLYDIIHPAGFAFIKAYFEADLDKQKEMWDPELDTGRIEEFGDHTGMKELIRKKLRGQESFILYSPVVRLVSVVNGIPAASNCGLRVTPPEAASAPSNYVYLQTADRTLPGGSGGRYTRTIEYTGADSIDEDIYPAAAGPNPDPDPEPDPPEE
jgi:hypothetical protein